MKRVVAALLTAVIVLVTGCAKAPYTGRNQIIMLSPKEEMALGYQTEQEILKTEKLSKNPEYVARVQRVGERIAKATGIKLDWKFYVIDKPDTPNAFCLANGHVFVYTGIFKYAKTDAELATVIAHEVGHAIAHHVAERLSVAMMTNLAAMGAAIAIDSHVHNSDERALYQMALGLGANVGVMLPYSRMQESEADHIGLMLMAKACYDPHAAIAFWESFSKADKAHVPVYFSTHPTNAQRIAAIKKLLPQAMKIYRESGCEARRHGQEGVSSPPATPARAVREKSRELGVPVE
ncbi:M48 family metallopeptidase [Hydrogenimonas sp.]